MIRDRYSSSRSGLLTALAAGWLSAPSRLPPRVRTIVFATTASLLAFAVIAMFVSRSDHKVVGPAPPARRGSLLLVAGVDTSTGNGALFKFVPQSLGFSCAQTFYYSYRGPGSGGPQGEARCPIRTGARYTKHDTTRPLRELTAGMRAQLSRLPRPIVVVTHSQGAWIAWSEITSGDDSGVRAIAMLAPFNEGLAPYPPTGVNRAGAAGGAAVRIVTDLGRSLGINQFDPDAPLARELQGTPGAVERLVGRHRLPRSVRVCVVLAATYRSNRGRGRTTCRRRARVGSSIPPCRHRRRWRRPCGTSSTAAGRARAPVGSPILGTPPTRSAPETRRSSMINATRGLCALRRVDDEQARRAVVRELVGTLPSTNRRTPVIPRLPTTTRSQSASLATMSNASAGSPAMQLLTARTPARSAFATASSQMR